MAQKPTFKGKNSSRIEVDLNSSEKKKQLANIAYWKGYGAMADFVRTVLFEHMEKIPDHFKRPRPGKDEEVA